METPEKQENNRNPDGTFKEGVSGNPAGRPKGKTLKEFAREYYLLKTDEEKRAYIEKIEEKKPGFAWEMAEGKAAQETDLTSGGKPVQFIVAREIAEKNAITSEPEHNSEGQS